jgi:hypothetical protein
MEGELTFPAVQAYQAAVKRLRDGRWMDLDGYLLDEIGHRWDDEAATMPEALTINFPYYLYRNLPIGAISVGARGFIVSTCTDGCFEGYVFRDGGWKNYDLENWATQRCKKPRPDDEDSDAYIDWLNDIEQDFFDTQLEQGDLD